VQKGIQLLRGNEANRRGECIPLYDIDTWLALPDHLQLFAEVILLYQIEQDKMPTLWMQKWAGGYYSQRFRCPLLYPSPTGESCEHAQFKKGGGCQLGTGRTNVGHAGSDSPLYHAIYNQCTSTERINSDSKALELERPQVRSIHSVHTLNTLTYLIINDQALQRARTLNTTLFTNRIGTIG
jgi:hypothetical protein